MIIWGNAKVGIELGTGQWLPIIFQLSAQKILLLLLPGLD